MKKHYETPVVQTLSSRDLIAALGPAQANASGRGGNVDADLTGFSDGGGSVDQR